MNNIRTFYHSRMSRLCEQVLSLMVVFLMLSATVLWSGRYFGHRLHGHGEYFNSAKVMSDVAVPLKELGLDPGTVQLAVRDSASWSVSGAKGDALGVIVSSAPYCREVRGYAGPTPVFVYVNAAGRVAAVAAGENADTPAFFRRAFEGIAPRFKGLTAHEAASLKVDAVSGATYSSKAIIANIEQTLAANAASANTVSRGVPAIGWGRTVAVAAVLLLGMFVSWMFRGHRKLRTIVLWLNVGVLGFWCGQFLSVSVLRGWLTNGVDAVAALPTLFVFAVAVLLPLFKRKNYYCTWVCPYGSLQELVGRLPLPKIRCGARVYKAMGRVRLWAFSLLMLLLWMGLGAEVLNYEPFSAFLFTSAQPAVMVLSATFVVAGCFVPRLWCRCLCPMGMLLNLSECGCEPVARPQRTFAKQKKE